METTKIVNFINKKHADEKNPVSTSRKFLRFDGDFVKLYREGFTKPDFIVTRIDENHIEIKDMEDKQVYSYRVA